MKKCSICKRSVPRLYNMVNIQTQEEVLLCPNCHNDWKKIMKEQEVEDEHI